MNLHFSYKAAKSPAIEKEIQQQIEKLEPRLRVFSPDLIHLHGTYDSAPNNGFTLALNLRLPSGQLFAQDEGASGEAAVKAGFADLTSQLNRHKDLLRSGHKWVREKGTMGEPEVDVSREVRIASSRLPSLEGPQDANEKTSNGHATPAEITAASFADENRGSLQTEVRGYLSANLAKLDRFVARELRFRESNGQVTPGRVSKEEVVDEVALAALSVEKRPTNISLERWIYRLCIHAIRMLATGNAIDLSSVPLEQSVGEQNVSGSDEDVLQYHQPGESISRADVTPDDRSPNPEEIAANDELIEQLEESLRGTKPEERETFVLYAIEGFTVKEIAEITLNTTEQVRTNILAARDHLVKKLPPTNSLKQKLLQHSYVA
ncbi:MAG: sigma-24, subfamily [Acidobacteriales bacterium]|nr:sigma-24, subfamily [Terriglobales bacterium]